MVLGDARLHLGTQGWNYDSWVGTFYPPGTRPANMLAIYGRAFPAVEIDSTSYGIPSDHAVQGWHAQVPAGFTFALKIPQEITHERRLKDSTTLLRRFVDRVSQLGGALGPFLVQLSPGFRPSDASRGVLKEFVAGLPEDFRWAVEFRDAGWMTAATFELLKSRNVAAAMVQGRWIRRELMAELALEPTADFAYVRWMGLDRRLTDFSRPQLDSGDDRDWWADLLGSLRSRVTDVWGFFSNYYEGHAPHSARGRRRYGTARAVQ